MRPDDRRSRPESQGGIPDGLLVGILAFLLGMTLLVWSATGLAALFAHGSWPSGVTFTRTPLAMRGLIAQPHDIPGAWPDTPPGELSGYGLFWGLIIGQLMILVVLTVFVMGTLARWRAVRARRGAERAAAEERAASSGGAVYEAPRPTPHDVPTPAQHTTPTSTQHDVPTPRRAAPEPTPTHLLEPTAPLAPTPAAAPASPASLFGQERVGGCHRARARQHRAPLPHRLGHRHRC
ncbi:type VI secretion protein, partial [Streptomyces coeruleorubidus]